MQTLSLRYYDAQRVIAQCSVDHDTTASRILTVKPGHGRHVHNSNCGCRPDNFWSCTRHCDDSDLVVTLAYQCPDGAGCCSNPTSDHEHWAVYGLLGEEFSLWQD